MSSGDTDISIQKGQACKVVQNYKNGWVKIDINGVVGLVPENYLQIPNN